MALTILRLATLYGEGDPGNVGRLMRTMDRGRFLWIGDGSNRESLLYKGDAAPACTMREIVDGIADALGKHPFPVRVPAMLALSLSRHLCNLGTRSQFLAKLGHVPRLPRLAGLHQTVKKWLAEDVYDTRRFEEAYGFQTKTSLEDGLK